MMAIAKFPPGVRGMKGQGESVNEPLVRLALTYLSRRDRSMKQLAQYLSSRGATPAAIGIIVQRCRDLGYLDDGAFARRWSEARLGKLPMGVARLEAELETKGFAEQEIAKTLDACYGECGELSYALRVLNELKGKQRLSLGRLVGTLRQRGFSEETIESVVRRSGVQSWD